MAERQLKPAVDGPFTGMLANARATLQEGQVSLAQNMILVDGEYVGRPGLVQLGSAIGGGADVQGIFDWQELDGTINTCGFANGDLYVYDWTGGTWTLYDLSAASVTLSSSAEIDCCVSRGRLVFTDGVNKPVMATGPVGSISYTTLTAAPIANFTGIYYDKVFFWDIPGSENEFEWSDEGNPTSGYSGDDQAWTFAQTDSGKILGMAPLNNLMDILKQDSATMLMGTVDENFQTHAVREGLSETEGTISGRSVQILEGDVYCVSQNGPRTAIRGQRWQSLHDAGGVDYIRDIWKDVDPAEFTGIFGWTDRSRKHVGWFYEKTGESTVHEALVFDKENVCWQLFDFAGLDIKAAAAVEDTSGNEWVLFGDTNGKVWKYGDLANRSDGSTAIERKVRSRPYGDSQRLSQVEKRMQETIFTLYLDTELRIEGRPVLDGVVGTGKSFGMKGETGKKIYRRGWNDLGRTVGWELYCNTAGQTFTLRDAATAMSMTTSGGNW